VSSPAELLGFAKKLLGSASSNVEVVTAVGRAYYAAYAWAKEFHDGLPLKGQCHKQNAGMHEDLITRLENPHADLDPELANISRYIGTQMRIAKPLREAADYNKGPKTIAADAEQAIACAEEVKDEASRGLRRMAKLRELRAQEDRPAPQA
jgi:hypothetical protein